MKVHSSSQRSLLAHMSSALKIEETELENKCSNLLLLEAGKLLPLLHLSCLSLLFLLMCCPLWEADSCLFLLHLTCVFLVYLVKCCRRSSLKPARPMCDGRSFASPLFFNRLAGQGPFFCGFPLRWVLCIALYAALCSGERSSVRMRSPMRHFVQSILTQVQQTKDIDLTCYKTLQTKSVTCLQVRPMSIEWPVALFEESDLPSIPPNSRKTLVS